MNKAGLIASAILLGILSPNAGAGTAQAAAVMPMAHAFQAEANKRGGIANVWFYGCGPAGCAGGWRRPYYGGRPYYSWGWRGPYHGCRTVCGPYRCGRYCY